MTNDDLQFRPFSSRYFSQWEVAPVDRLAEFQRQALRRLLREVRARNPFQARQLELVPDDHDSTATLPFVTRDELQLDQEGYPPFGTNLSEPIDRYTRFHQTSGTHGRPMRWLDTPASWKALTDCWCTIFTAAGVTSADRVLFPFSFGPFLGFWVAFDGAARLGAMVIPAGGTSTLGRLQMIFENSVTVVCCTPTYALHMAEVAAKHGIDLAGSTVKSLIVAGEPGGNIPEVRAKIEKAWGARLFDHHGMTEVGPVSFECRENPGGLHINEEHYLAEVIDPATLQPVPDGTPGELVLTTLLRTASPLIRYRTGDQVILTRGQCACGRHYARLEGGILGRVDDMFTVRGNNVFPSAVEAILRRFDEVAEFRLTVFDRGPLAAVQLEVEPTSTADVRDLCEKVSRVIHDELHFKADVMPVEVGSLPRFEMKAKRFVRK